MEDKITNDVVIEIKESLDASEFETRRNPNKEVKPMSSFLEQNVEEDDKQSKQPKVLLQSTSFICIVSFFIATISINTLFSNLMLMGMELWKWFAFALVVCCSPLLAAWFVSVVIFLIEMNFVMSEKKKKVIYFVYGMKSSVVSFFCSCSVLLSWFVVIDWNIKGTALIHLITSTLGTFVIGAAMWMLKIVILKVLSCRFHDNKLFDKIQFLIFQQSVLQTLLWGPSLMFVPANCAGTYNIRTQLKWIKEAVVDMLGANSRKRIFTVCDALDKTSDDEGDETLKDEEIKTVVSRIFKNLAKNGLRYVVLSPYLLIVSVF